MITCYFGVPGCGKTTLLTKFAVQELKLIKKGKSKYNAVYTNFYCKGAKKVDFNDFKTHIVRNSLIIFDEITMDADNRKFKQFPDSIRDFFILHRHVGCDIIYATQSFEMVDLKIRQLTQELWYMSRSVIPILTHFTYAKRIYRQININEHTSDLTLGYRFCNLLEAFFVSNMKYCLRKPYYKYFDSYEEGILGDRPVLISDTWDNSKKPPSSVDVCSELPETVVASATSVNLDSIFPNHNIQTDGTSD